jgi:hypothetical protein
MYDFTDRFTSTMTGMAGLMASGLLLLACTEGRGAANLPDDPDPDAAAPPVQGSDPEDSGTTPPYTTPPVGDVDGACLITLGETHPHDSNPAPHVPVELDPSEYNSSPPSSGPHCGSWGQYATYEPSAPLPACNYLHNLEHGAVALLYNCPEGCPDVVAALGAILADPPDDPDCAAPRLLLTPYEDMDALVAAAAWGHTWTSEAFDECTEASLRAFIETHIGSRGTSPEPMVCANGSIAP